jgi:5-methylcytosine-specific restriction protein A
LNEYKTVEQKTKFYTSYAWKKLRQQVIERDNYECQECKRQGKVFINTHEMNKSGKRKKISLIVHHLKELEEHPELALDIDNLETVCVNCHNKIHDRYYQWRGFEPKRNRFAEDERW